MLQQSAERVTAGLPSLTPQKRDKWDTLIRTRAVTDQAVREEKQRNDFSVASDGDTDTTDITKQLGQIMSADEFIRRARIINPNLIFEQSIRYPRLIGIYVRRDITDLERMLGAIDRRHVCGMEAQMMPEFSVRHTAEEQVPDMDNPGNKITRKKFVGETRGWRTVLARLIREGLISLAQAEKHFPIANGRTSANWQLLVN